MSEKISIVKDVFTNTPHIIAVSDNDSVKVKALTEYGKSIIEDYKFVNGYTKAAIPDGFVKTEFKELSPQMQEMFDAAFSQVGWNNEQINKITNKVVNQQKVKSFLDRTSNENRRNHFKNPSSRSLFRFRDKANKINILNYKAKTFKDNSTTSSLVEKVKSHELAFDIKYSVMLAKNNNPLSSYRLETIIQDSKNVRLLRRGVDSETKQDALIFKGKKRRVVRRASVLSSPEEKEKHELSGTQKFKESIKSKLKNRKRFTK